MRRAACLWAIGAGVFIATIKAFGHSTGFQNAGYAVSLILRAGLERSCRRGAIQNCFFLMKRPRWRLAIAPVMNVVAGMRGTLWSV
ncbi:MAG: hypothetical protein CBB65_15970 [Hyphomonadaceae bacterium TMED5]|nr:hypothetical protein [Ponticaulis sp.]OUX96403.1 MAG: hypothetical protein CBB65_15970 [Hyphomonadaceae bacterium TMED5]